MASSFHTWVQNKRPLGQIVIARAAKEHERFAAEELSRYFEKVSGTPLPATRGIGNRALPSMIIPQRVTAKGHGLAHRIGAD